MFKTSTYFIKEQIPGTTIDQLIDRYKKELEKQRVSSYSIKGGTIDFLNNRFKFVLDRYNNNFSSFSKGRIKIEDSRTEFVVYLEASLGRLFATAGISGGIAIIFFLLNAEWNLFPFLFGTAVFVLLAVIGFILVNISFPVYFTSLRNRIEREIQGLD